MQFYTAENQETPVNVLEACLMTLLKRKAEYLLTDGWFLYAYIQQVCNDAHFVLSRGVCIQYVSATYLSSIYLSIYA